MARPKTLHIDESALLNGIADVTLCQIAALDAEIARCKRLGNNGFQAMHRVIRERVALLRDGVAYDLIAFMGRSLTNSERQLVQQAIRRMEAEGLLEIPLPRHVKLSPAGLARVESLAVEPANG